MKPTIKVTKHAIEEYLKDNPKCIEPERVLKELFIKMLSWSKRKNGKVHFWDYRDRPEFMMRLGNEVVIYDTYCIITYYKFIPEVFLKAQEKYKKKFRKILSGKTEASFLAKKRRKIMKEYSKTHRYTNTLAKAFNTR